MDSRPVGILDSGLGGLTAVKELRKLLPNEKIVYFGDTGRNPYGTRSNETLRTYLRQDVAFLREHNVKCLIVACGTLSSTVLPQFSCDIPVVDVIGPAAALAARDSRNRRVGVMATTACIRGMGFQKTLARLSPDIQVTVNDAPLLVPIIENGRVTSGDIVAETLVEEYLAPHIRAGVDTLILGCTHYPLLTPLIEARLAPGVTLINSGAEAAREMAEVLRGTDEEADRGQTGESTFYVSDNVEGFSKSAGLFLGEPVGAQAFWVDTSSFL